MKLFFILLLSLSSTIVFAKNDKRKIANTVDCVKQADALKQQHIEAMKSRFGSDLNAQDLQMIEEDGAMVARISARSCSMIELQKR